MSSAAYGLLLTRMAWGPVMHRVTNAQPEPRAGVLGQQIRKQVERGAPLVVAVRGALHDGRVGAERGVVDEDAVPDLSEVYPQLDTVGERLQARRGVLAVEPEVQREVIAGSRGDHQEGKSVLRGDARHQGLSAVSASDAEKICAVAHRLLGQSGDVDHLPLQQRHLGAEFAGPVGEVELLDLAASRARVHDQERLGRRRGLVLCGRRERRSPSQRAAAGPERGPPQQRGHDDHPHEIPARVHHHHDQGRGDRQNGGQPAQHASMGEEPPDRDEGDHDTREADEDQGDAATETGSHQRKDHRGGRHEEGEARHPALPQRGDRLLL